MREQALAISLIVLGVTALVIGTSNLLLGAHWTASQFASVMAIFQKGGEPITDLSTPNADNELRFYAALWVAYGWLLFQTARDLNKHRGRVPMFLLVFFAGGIGRAISYFFAGPPHLLFVMLMWIELIIPPIVYWLWRKEVVTKGST